jgi:hypothetical protein
MSHGGERSPQHGDATFYSEINSFFNLYDLFYALLTADHTLTTGMFFT